MSRGVPVREVETLDALMDSLLVEWYQYFHGYSYGTGQGYRASDATTQDYCTPTHFDWANGAADAHADRVRMRGINEAIEAIPNVPHRWRTALEFNARNLHTGYSVWHSLVLPKDREELEILVIEARTKFLLQLRYRSLIG